MTTGDICVITVMGYPIISGIIGLYLIENCDDKISECETAFCTICWPLVILFFIFIYITKFLGMVFTLFMLPCKKIKQVIELKKSNKIEENKRKKELVNTVLKELNLR